MPSPYAWTDCLNGDTVERHCVDMYSRPICGEVLDLDATHHSGGGLAYLGEVPRPGWRSIVKLCPKCERLAQPERDGWAHEDLPLRWILQH